MALATRCPSCNTIFRISTAQAAAKGGMVRCGQCGNVFNSLDALVRVEDLEVSDEISVAPAPTSSDANRVGDEGQASTGEQAVERAVVGAWRLPEGVDVPAGTARPVVAAPDGAATSSLRDDAGLLLSGRRTDLAPHASDLDGTHPAFMRPDPDVTPHRRGQPRLFGVLTSIAAAALLAQAVYHWRDELAVRWSPAKPWLVAACVALRCQVGYPAHIDSITIESASIQAAAPNLNVYVLTALLRNRDAVDLRYPHLELVLTDLQDRPMLRRVLRPEDYLPAAAGAGTITPGFPAESELPIRVMFELDDLRFAGYRLDRFYP